MMPDASEQRTREAKTPLSQHILFRRVTWREEEGEGARKWCNNCHKVIVTERIIFCVNTAFSIKIS